MLKLILIITLLAYFCKLFTLSIGNFQLRPILMGPLVGLLLGDLGTGLLFGAYLEMIFLGFFGVGGAPAPEAELSGVVAVACSIYAQQDFPALLAAGLITGYCGLFLFKKGVKPFSSKMAVKEQVAIAEGKIASFERKHRLVIYSVPLFYVPLAIALSFFFIDGLFPLLTTLPTAVLTYLNVFALLYPAVGLAHLVKNECTKELLPFVILGFGLGAYLKVNSMFILLIVGVLAFVLIYLGSKPTAAAKETTVENDEDEDDFF